MTDEHNGRNEPWEDRFVSAVEAIDAALEAGLDPDVSSLAEMTSTERSELEGIKSCLRLLKGAYAPGQTTAAGKPRAAVAPEIAGYTIEQELGHGGMGVVFLARQASLERRVALKVIGSGAQVSDDDRRRFRIEAEAAARLHHPHIIEVHEVGVASGLPYLVMEYMDAGNLAQELRGKPLPADHAAEVLILLAGAVHHAHQQGVIHRDLKPGNVLLRQRAAGQEIWAAGSLQEDYQIKVGDFGLAKRLDDDTGKTRTGAIIGTPSYMSPEQAEGRTEATGPAVDIYALGAILYELLTGRPPFQGPTLLEILQQVRTQEPIAPRSLQPSVPRDLETICLKCLEKTPGRRYASARAIEEELKRYCEGKPILARRANVLERGLRWADRHRMVAGLLLAVAVSMLAGTSTSVALMLQAREESQRADQNAEDFKGEAQRADELARKASARAESEKAARLQTEQALYLNRIARAQREWEAGDVARVRQLLDECRPAPGAPDLRRWEWYYLERRLRTAAAGLPGLDGRRLAVFHPTGKVVTSAGSAQFEVLNIPTGEIQVVGATEYVLGVSNSILFHPDGQTFISLRTGQSSKWNLQIRAWPSAKVLRLVPLANVNHIPRSAFSPDGRYLAVSLDSRVLVFSTGDYQQVATFPDPEAFLAWSPDSKLLATSFNNKIKKGKDATGTGFCLRTVPEGTLVRAWEGHQHGPGGLAFNARGDILASGSADRSIALWEMPGGRLLRKLFIPYGYIRLIDFHPKENLLVSASSDGALRLWDADTGLLLRSYQGHRENPDQLDFSPDGHYLLSSDGKTWRLWDVTASIEYEQPVRHIAQSQVAGIKKALSPDGKYFACSREIDKSARHPHYEILLFDVATGKLLYTFTYKLRLWWLHFSPDSQFVIAGGNGSKFWNVNTGEQIKHLPGSGYGYTFSKDHSLYAVATKSRIAVYETATGKRLHNLEPHGFVGQIHSIALDRSKRRLAATGRVPVAGTKSGKNAVRVWDLASNQLLSSTLLSGRASNLAFDQSGDRVLGSTTGDLVFSVDVATGKLAQHEVTRQQVRHFQFFENGQRILLTDMETIRILDSDWNELLVLEADIRPLRRVVFAPDRQSIIAVGDLGIAVWDGRPMADP